MKLAEIVRADGAQLVKLPEGFQLEGDIVSKGSTLAGG